MAFSKEQTFSHLSVLYLSGHLSTACITFDWSSRMFSTYESYNFEIKEKKRWNSSLTECLSCESYDRTMSDNTT